jgi:nicotinamide riboside kinase
MIRISLTGSHSTGKTTLANLVAEYYAPQLKVERISEVARELIGRRFKMSKDITEYGIINYAYQYLYQERTKKGDLIIADRSIIDMMGYITVNKSPKVRCIYNSLIDEIMFINKSKYDIYFYIPLEIPFVGDGIRPEDDKYREDVDQAILGLLQQYKINYIKIIGGIQERKEKMIRIIDKHIIKKI